MAWDTDRTRTLLLEAAVEEFADHGFAGARVDRIAARAQVNKERIYQYFGSKKQLFSAVLEREMTALAAAVPLTVEQAADLGAFAGRIFDYHHAYPRYMRLLLWEGLQGGPDDVAAPAERTAHYANDVRVVAAAQAKGALRDDVAPEHLLYAARALAGWWLAVPHAIRLMLGPQDSAAAQRRTVVQFVNELTRPRHPEHP